MLFGCVTFASSSNKDYSIVKAELISNYQMLYKVLLFYKFLCISLVNLEQNRKICFVLIKCCVVKRFDLLECFSGY